MTYAVLIFTKRARGTELTCFQEAALQRARASEAPAGCTCRAHSRAVARAYRQGEPAYDTLDEQRFEDFAAADAWRRCAVQAHHGGDVPVILTRVVPVTSGPLPAGSLKHLELVHRRGDLDRAAFLHYWRDVHGPLAASIPGVLRYEQCPRMENEYEIGQPALDGVAMLWFASMESMREGALDPAFARTRADMACFMDTTASASLLTEEVWFAEGASRYP